MLWIVEPHSDDAYISLHEHITWLWKDLDKTLVTVYCTKDPVAEASESGHYASATDCNYLWHGLWEDGWKAMQPLPSLFELLPGVKAGDTIVLPLGIRQPAHLAIANISIPEGLYVLWYLDAKYIQQIAREEVQHKTRELIVYSILASSIDKSHYKNIFLSHAHQFLLASDLYPPPVEILLRKPQDDNKHS